MDKEHARHILSHFHHRPDEVPADELATALEWAAKDRELSEWLIDERGHDAAFARAIKTIKLPDGLRDEILAVIDPEKHFSAGRDDFDEAMMAGIQTIHPPERLRAEILMAMNQSAPASAGRGHRWWKIAAPLAAAAGITMALIISFDDPGATSATPHSSVATPTPASSAAIPVSRVVDSSITHLSRADFQFTHASSDLPELFAHIREQGLPCATRAVPAGLMEHTALGCSFVRIGQHRAAIICFRLGTQGKQAFVHLVVLPRGDVALDKEPDAPNRRVHRHGDWSALPWSQDERVFVLLTEGPPEKLEKLF